MIIKSLYKYKSGNNVIFSLEKPDCEYTELIRLIATKGMGVTKEGTKIYTVLDIKPEELNDYYEVELPKREPRSTRKPHVKNQ